MKAEAFLAKAETALRAARILLDSGDSDGACNRAYYAMFDAARASLMATNVAFADEQAKTHSGLISIFGLHIAKTALVDRGLGRMFNKAHEIRLVADYTGDLVEHGEALGMVERAEVFVAD